MTRRPEARPETPTFHRRPADAQHRLLDDHWNQQMTQVLREAADARAERDRARSSEDELAARRESAALLDLIRAPIRPGRAPATRERPRDGRPDKRS